MNLISQEDYPSLRFIPVSAPEKLKPGLPPIISLNTQQPTQSQRLPTIIHLAPPAQVPLVGTRFQRFKSNGRGRYYWIWGGFPKTLHMIQYSDSQRCPKSFVIEIAQRWVITLRHSQCNFPSIPSPRSSSIRMEAFTFLLQSQGPSINYLGICVHT